MTDGSFFGIVAFRCVGWVDMREGERSPMVGGGTVSWVGSSRPMRELPAPSSSGTHVYALFRKRFRMSLNILVTTFRLGCSAHLSSGGHGVAPVRRDAVAAVSMQGIGI